MKKLFCTIAAGLALLAATGIALADDIASQARAIDDRVTKVTLDGVVNLRVKQGTAPTLVVFAERQLLPRITSSQSADTLTISSNLSGIRLDRSAIRAELTLPALHALHSRGVGDSVVTGFDGDTLQLALIGSGSIDLTSRYRHIEARLSGVGHMNINGSDGNAIDVSLPGAGSITLRGKTKGLKADLAGVGSLDARNLQAETCDLDLSGMSSAAVTVRDDAVVDLNGIGSVTIYGQPSKRRVSVNGIGKVIWK